MTEEIKLGKKAVVACNYWKACDYYKRLKRLEQENKELKKQHYEALKMLKHEYDGRQKDNEQWFMRCTENHNEDSKIIENYRSALEEIKELSNIKKEWAVFMKPIDRLEKINKIVCDVLK